MECNIVVVLLTLFSDFSSGVAGGRDKQEEMKESFNEVHNMMNEIHLDVANAVNYSLDATNAMFDMANKLMARCLKERRRIK